MPIRNILSHSLCTPLWGDRARWGLTPNYDDPCWQQWQSTVTEFYQANQREGIGTRVNDAGYTVMSTIDLTGKRVLEIELVTIVNHEGIRSEQLDKSWIVK